VPRSALLLALLVPFCAACGGDDEPPAPATAQAEEETGLTAPEGSYPDEVPPAPAGLTVFDAGGDERVKLTIGVDGKRVIPPRIGVPAGRPIDLQLVSLDGHRHVIVIGRIGRDPALQVKVNAPVVLEQAPFPAGTHDVVLDGKRGAGEIRALTPPQLRRAKARQEPE
jgi:hypothetical protein